MTTLALIEAFDDAYSAVSQAQIALHLAAPGTPEQRRAFAQYDIAQTRCDEARDRLRASGFPLRKTK